MPDKSYVSPTGSPIKGTLERISGVALIVGIKDDGEPIYAGETEVWWDEQKTARNDANAMIFVDEEGDEWTFDQLKVAEECHE